MPELICFAVFCNVSEYLIAELGRGVCTRLSRHVVVWLVLAIRFLLRFCLVWFYSCQSVNGWVQSIPFSSLASSLSFLALLPLTVPLSDSDHVMDLSVCLPWSCLFLLCFIILVLITAVFPASALPQTRSHSSPSLILLNETTFCPFFFFLPPL